MGKETGSTATITPDMEQDNETKKQPPYNVILHDSDDHSYEYVITMLMKLFRKNPQEAVDNAVEVDKKGRTICMTTTLEHAEFKRDQIHSYGADGAIAHCKGSMKSTIEPVG